MTISDSDWEAFQRYISGLPKDVLRKKEQQHADEADALYNNFKASFVKGLCNTCGESLNSFIPKYPCFHWLLRPKGSKKSHIIDVFQTKGYFRTASSRAVVSWLCKDTERLHYLLS